MINVTVIGDRALVAKLEAMPRRLHDILLKRMWSLVQKLKAKVQRKLSGEVLKVRSGALRRSIHADVDDSPETITGRVFSSGDVKYARIHELGGQTRAHLIEARKGLALSFMMGGKRVIVRAVHHPGSKIPARPYMAPSLQEMRGEIISTLSEGLAAEAMGAP